MDEYIKREEAIEAVKHAWAKGLEPSQYLEIILTADVAPVVHGRWVLLDDCSNEGVYCSACHKKVYKVCYANQQIKSKFCPNCGAKMDGGAD